MAFVELKDECIICLSDTPDVIKYDEQCDCKPYIHTSCRDKWFTTHPSTCPICKQVYKEEVFDPCFYLLLVLSMLLISLFICIEYFL